MHIRTKGLRQLLNLLILSIRHGRCCLACIKSNVKAILIEEHLYSASANVSKSERADTRYAHPKCETMKMTLIDSLHDRAKERVLKIVQDEYLHLLFTDFSRSSNFES